MKKTRKLEKVIQTQWLKNDEGNTLKDNILHNFGIQKQNYQQVTGNDRKY